MVDMRGRVTIVIQQDPRQYVFLMCRDVGDYWDACSGCVMKGFLGTPG